MNIQCLPTLPKELCKTTGSIRRLSAHTGNSHAVHVTASGQVARVKVVAALTRTLDGGDGFESLVDGNAAISLWPNLYLVGIFFTFATLA